MDPSNDVQKFTTKLLRKSDAAERTMSFFFARPSSDWSFKAGQSVDVTIQLPDREKSTHAFSIASAPFEQVVQVTCRLRDSVFKRFLQNMSPGDEVSIEGPFGELYHPTVGDARPCVVLCGGIGITPFRSVLVQANRDGFEHRVTLFHANRHLRDAPFYDELSALAQANPTRMTFVPVFSAERPSWEGEHGHINATMLQRCAPNVSSSKCFVTGPEGFAKSVRSCLLECGVLPEDIHTEEFAGY